MDIVHYIYIRGGTIGMILDRDLRSHIMSVADFTFGVDRIGWIHTIKDRYDTNARSFPCYGDAMKHVHDQYASRGVKQYILQEFDYSYVRRFTNPDELQSQLAIAGNRAFS